MPRKDPQRVDRGPKLTEDVCIAEEVKIGITLALQRFRLDPTQEELAFPTSLSATERAFVHRNCSQLGGLQTWSRGTGSSRYITIRKVEGGKDKKVTRSYFSIGHSLPHVNNILSKYPVTAKEKQDLSPPTSRTAPSSDSNQRDVFERLTTNMPQIPAQRGNSDLAAFRHSLPVFQMGEDIVKKINTSNVILIAGETGSGKTTQVPQLIMDDCFNERQPCRILCTQPRRLAAVSIAERVAHERGERVGQAVGYQIRLESKVSPKTVLTFCTNGVLLRALMGGDGCLEQMTHIIVDEVHERDRFSDFLLLCLKEALPKHPNLRLVLMSATLNMDLFAGYFDGCPVVCVPGNLYDVEEYFLEDILKWTEYRNKAMDKALSKKITAKNQEDQLNEWCSKRLVISGQSDSVIGSGTEDSDVTTSDNAELGEECEDLEAWVVEEMDHLLKEVWLTGRQELFPQILYLISSENVSVDYVQSETGTTPLMTASARGFTPVVEHLLNLGARAGFKTANQWTALDFAKKFGHEDIIGLLEAQMKTLSEMVAEHDTPESMDLISPEDRVLLTAYQQSFDDEKVDISLVTSLLDKIHNSGVEGAILVFLPGYDDIMNLRTEISEDRRFQGPGFVVYLLHSSLQHSDQKKVFKNPPHGVRKIILSTNIAETSLTINDVVFVVDCGKVKEKTFDALSSLTMLKSNWISKASAMQRKGRAGRCQAGKCYHMFSRARYVHLQDYQTPEILRLPLQELCLHTKLLASTTESIHVYLGKCPQAPPQLVIHTAVLNLRTIDALDQFEDLTELGKHLAELPIEPRLGKIILYSVALKCLDPVLTIVCTLSFKEPFVLPSLPYEKRAVMTKKRGFAEETYSDHIVFLRAFQAWQKAKSEGWERAFCEKNYISSSTMEMLSGMRTQLLSQLKASGFLRARGACDMREMNTNSDNWPLVKACLVAGTYPNIIQRDSKKNVLCTSMESCVRFHNSSVLMPVSKASNRSTPTAALKKEVKALPSNWLIYEEMSRTTNTAIAKVCTVISPVAVFLFAGHSKVTLDNMITETPGAEDEEEDIDSRGVGVTAKLDSWLSFGFQDRSEAETAMLFRMKWHSLFLNRVRRPGQPFTQEEEAVLQAVCAVVTNAEQALGIGIPVGIGQRPRSIEPYLGGGYEENYNHSASSYHQNHQQYHNQHYYKHHQQHHQPHYHHHQQHNNHQQHQYFSHHQQMYRNHNNRGGYNHYQHQRGGYHSYGKYGGSQGGGRGGGGGSRSSTPGSNDPQTMSSSSSLAASAPTPSSGVSDRTVTPEDGCRYFVMKCANQKMVDISEAKGIWATSATNEAKLNRAFQTAHGVYLIFLVPGNANFQGYAKMTSLVGKTKSTDFPGSGLTGAFSVEWVKRAILPFSMTSSLLNPWNENKRVHSSKDGQELAPRVATELLQLWDRHQLRRPHSAAGAAGTGGKGRSKKPANNQQQQQQGSRPPQHQHQRRPKKEKQAGKDSPLQADSSSGSSSSNSPAHQASAANTGT